MKQRVLQGFRQQGTLRVLYLGLLEGSFKGFRKVLQGLYFRRFFGEFKEVTLSGSIRVLAGLS